MSYQLFNEDCLQGMKRIADGSVDCILTDLPYGITDCAFDVRIPFAPMWEQFKRVTKRNAAIVLFSQMPFGAELIMSNRKMFRYEWMWAKPHPQGFLNANKMPLRAHENILVFYRALPTYNPQFAKAKPYSRRNFVDETSNHVYGNHRVVPYAEYEGRRYPIDIINSSQPVAVYFGKKSGEVVHPTQKPVQLLEYLIRTYTNEGELVLDATMGSGSTGVACMNTGRNFIGFETEKKFYDIACKRLSEAQAKQEQSLFKDVGA